MSDRARRHVRLEALERRITGPKRLALFGHRAVGKTTLLAMFYREASSGRVPGVRLAAADASTAEYLASRIARLEAGEPPPGTLAETELNLRLYHDLARFDLIVKDYQGEHVSLDSEAPIREFFADCDAVFLCLDPDAAPVPAERRRRQQEVEALLERYLEGSEDGTAGRPVALLVTKYDRVLEAGGPPPGRVEALAEDLYGMTRHALAQHVPRSAIFAVSSFGPGSRDGLPPAELHPMGLDQPLTWLAEQLEDIDRDRLDWLWDLAPEDRPRLERCVAAYARRYPKSDRIEVYEDRLTALRRRHRRRRLGIAAATATAALVGVLAYDAWGYRSALAAERSNRPAVELERRWTDFVAWHPTHRLWWPDQARTAREKLRQWTVRAAAERVAAGTAPGDAELSSTLERVRQEDPRLAGEVREVEAARARQRHDDQWRQLQADDRAAGDDPEARLAAYRAFVRAFPETEHRAEAESRIRALESENEARRTLTERQELDTLKRELALPDPDLGGVVERARAFLEDHPQSALRPEVEKLLAQTTRRIDEAGIQEARNFSRNFPTNFATRRRKYEEYLAAHPEGGAFVREALDALAQIDRERDVYTYRKAYDHARAYPRDIPVVARLLQSYLDTVPDGRHAAAAREYLGWWDRIQQPQDYRVTLVRGHVEPTVGKYLSGGGPNLAVELWVGGVKYGPTAAAPDSHDPIWNYTFSRPVRWKVGDPIAVRIIDMDWSTTGTGVYRITSVRGDPLAMRFLSGPIRPATGGRTELVFRSDFKIPTLPRPEG